MAREIKFRFYDTLIKEMLSMQEFLAAEMNLEVALQGVNIIKVMQYTELKDKNGVKIYEGDVVRNSGLWVLRSTDKLQYVKRAYGGGEIFVVNLNVTGVELRHRDDWNGNAQKDFAPNGYHSEPYVDSHDAWNLQKTLEVIGNIYENPELLEADQ